MFAAGSLSTAGFYGAVPSSATGSTPRSRSAPYVVSSDALVIAGVSANVMLGTSFGVRAPPLHDFPSDATGSAPRSVSAPGIAMSTSRVLTEVPAVNVLDSMTGFRATPLHPVRYSSVLD